MRTDPNAYPYTMGTHKLLREPWRFLADARANPLSRIDARAKAREFLSLPEYRRYAQLCKERGLEP